MQDARAAGDLCREAGILFLLDASQTAGGLPISVTDLGVHLLAAPGHKGLLGPQGTGILYVAPELELKPLLQGGTGSKSEGRCMPPEMPDSLEAGTLNGPGIAGLGEGVRYVIERGVDAIRRHEVELLGYALPELARVKGVRVYGPTEPSERVAVVSFNVEGWSADDLGQALDGSYGIAVRTGLHCAPEAHRALGTFPAGSVRASFGPFTTRPDVEALVRALHDLPRL